MPWGEVTVRGWNVLVLAILRTMVRIVWRSGAAKALMRIKGIFRDRARLCAMICFDYCCHEKELLRHNPFFMGWGVFLILGQRFRWLLVAGLGGYFDSSALYLVESLRCELLNNAIGRCWALPGKSLVFILILMLAFKHRCKVDFFRSYPAF